MRIRSGRGRPERYVATVLFVDIAGSTQLAAEIGDDAWKALLRRHYAALRDRLRRHGGREIDTAGDGLFAAFTTPAEAVTCALEMVDAAAGLDIAVRVGVHTGEVQDIEGKVGGLAVHIGARIAAVAEPGRVVVSGTVRDLVAGSGLRFDPMGEVELRGVPGEWRLFVVVPNPTPRRDPSADVDGTASAAPTSNAKVANVPRRVWGGLGVLAAGLIAILVAGNAVLSGGATAVPTPSEASSPSAPSSAVPVIADSVARLSSGGVVEASATVGRLPSGIAVAEDGSIWVTNTTDGSVSRLDPTASRVVDTIRDVGVSPTAILAAFGAIWVADSGERAVARIDPGVDRVVRTYDVGNAPTGLASDGTSIWASVHLDGTLARIRPDSSDGAIQTFPVALSPQGVAFGAGSLWTSDSEAGTVVRVDPATGSVQGTPIHVGNGAAAIAASESAVWVANRLDGTVSRIDPTTASVSATIPLGGAPAGLVADEAAAWVAIPSSGALVAIDSTAAAVGARVSLTVAPQAVAMDDGAPLFTTAAAPGGHRGGTLRIAAGSDQQAGPPDPSVTDESLLLPLTNDALLTYRQVGGSDAVDLVPDLATTIPGSSDGGSTWTFRLRSGITYSDGTPLAASDVRRSAERAIAAGRVTGVTTTVEGISGAAECTPDRCDLRRGIEVDDAAGTVTFHLSQPDPRFLDALPFLFIVPGRTPLAVSQTPLPATGPYAFDTVAPDHVVLRRNPMFRVWSADAQPDGYPDEIDWQTYDDPVAVVASGAADVLSATLDGQTLQQLETTNASQLVISPSMQTWFEMMNTKVAPFDDPSVRQAVNLAVDRAEVARLYGAGKVTCQVVQPGFAGYEPYCPYTIAPDGSGTWRGPDPRAKDMIPPRYRGMRVTVEGADIPGHADVARYFAGLLDALGFKADLKLSDVPTFFGGEGPLAGPSDAQMAGYWFLIGSPAASSMIPGAFTCPDYRDAPVVPGNYPQDFCDRALDARITHALRSEASVDPAERAAAEAEWAAIDRAIVDAAPAVIPFNVQNVDFVSRRVGNIQHHRVQGLLLDQLWLDGPG